MQNKHNKKLVPLAKTLRKNMTKEERKLWYDFLRTHSTRFTRQKVLGKYIVDFYCPKAKLVIELDGSQHFTQTGLESDQEREQFLKNFNITFLRIPNNQVNENFSGVCEYIDILLTKLL